MIALALACGAEAIHLEVGPAHGGQRDRGSSGGSTSQCLDGQQLGANSPLAQVAESTASSPTCRSGSSFCGRLMCGSTGAIVPEHTGPLKVPIGEKMMHGKVEE